MSDIKEWSQIGQQLNAAGTPLFCPKCNFKLIGERFCPNCGMKIIYSGEETNASSNLKKIGSGFDALGSFSKSMGSLGDSMTGCGCSIIGLFILIALLIAIL